MKKSVVFLGRNVHIFNLNPLLMNEFDKMMSELDNENILLSRTSSKKEEETVSQESVGFFDPNNDEFKCKRKDYSLEKNTIAYHVEPLLAILDPLLRDRQNEKTHLANIKIKMFEILNNEKNGEAKTRKKWKLVVEKCTSLTALSFTMTNIHQAAAGNRIHAKALA